MIQHLKSSVVEGKEDVSELLSLEIYKAKLKAAEGFSEVSVKALTLFVRFLLIGFILFFFGMGLAFLLNELIDFPGIGFLLMGMLFVIALFLFKIFKKKWVERPIIKMYMKLLFPKKEKD
ncbi:MAG: hypothetical protein VZQ98_05895 [Bacteroidales bacterium]|nr:hypothetical protein [Bacteroidales bacterium]